MVLHGSLHYVQWVPHAAILQIFYCLAWIYTVEFNSLSYTNNEMYDDAVFADRFRHQLTMFGIGVLIGISRLLHARIAYETILQQYVRWCGFRCSIPISIGNVEICILIGLSRLLDTHIAYEIAIQKITTDNYLDAENNLLCRTVVKR